MIDLSTIRYPAFDKPEICRFLFYPRREAELAKDSNAEHIIIPVEKNIDVGGRFHEAGKGRCTILFFHGNGEIAADYDDVGAMYSRLGINFFPVDYRGYGRSSGVPTVTSMMRDSHTVFDYVTSWLAARGFTGPMVIMGRSLGSAPAMEIAFHYEERIDGLIIESGFAYILPLLNLLGIHDPELTEAAGPRNREKIKRIKKPILLIHAEYDQIIPFAEGEELYKISDSSNKKLLTVHGADHNDIFFRGMEDYLNTIRIFVETIKK